MLRGLGYRNAYMKRVDKPTKQLAVKNLPDIKKTSAISLKFLWKGKLTKSLASKTFFCCLNVFKINTIQTHLKPAKTPTGKGENTKEKK